MNYSNRFFTKKYNQNRLKKYLHFIHQILSYNFNSSDNILLQKNAIQKIIKLLSLDVQQTIIEHTINNEFDYDFDLFFTQKTFFCSKCQTTLDICHTSTKISSQIPFDISFQPAISSPWNSQRLVRSFGSIGKQVSNPFHFEEINHMNSLLIFPLNLLIIGNGYHSSTSGIFDIESIYYPQDLLDISDWYKEIYFDGNFFKHITCDHKLYNPENKSLGIIYEIGRLLQQKNISLVDL